jgi:tetratricopeptide (TPR) repeat protein
VPFFKQAVALDPNFAIAIATLGQVETNLGDRGVGAEYAKKAYSLRDRASEAERFYIDSHYYDNVTGDTEQSIQVYQLWTQTYPRDSIPFNNLGVSYAQLGEWEKSLPAARRAHELNPDESIAFVAVAGSYIGLGRFDEAKATIDQGLAQKLDVPNFHRLLYSLAFVQNNPPAMERELSILASKGAEATAISYLLAAQTEACGGRLQKARGLFERSRTAFEASHTNEAAAQALASLANSEAAVGDSAGARRDAAAALAINSSVHVKINGANAFASAGDAGRAEALAEEIAKERPSDTLVNGYELPTIRATLAINSNNPAKALELLQPVIPYDLSSTRAMRSTYLRGNAYLALHKGSEAAAEFQKIVDHPGVVLNAMTGPLAKLGLARAYALEGDSAKARVAYQDLFALWKDADPNLAILIAAKSEYAKLQ